MTRQELHRIASDFYKQDNAAVEARNRLNEAQQRYDREWALREKKRRIYDNAVLETADNIRLEVQREGQVYDRT